MARARATPQAKALKTFTVEEKVIV